MNATLCFPELPDTKPSWQRSLPLCIVVTAVWGTLRLGIFQDMVMPLTYVLPLLVCVWSRDRRQLWGMAAVFVVMATAKMFWLLPERALPPFDAWASYISQLLNILIAGVIIHAIVGLRAGLEQRQFALEVSNRRLAAANDEIVQQNERLQATNHELEVYSEELAAREEEISRQNEELQSQSEELAQQNEELRTQAEELEQSTEELTNQTEELQSLNDELAAREGMLDSLLGLVGVPGDESTVLNTVCRQSMSLLGPDVIGAAILELRDGQLFPHAHCGIQLGDTFDSLWPLKRSLAGLAIEERRTAALDNLALRPDLIFPRAEGEAPFQSILATPLRVDQRTIGAIEFFSSQPRPWTEDQFRLAEWVAGQCASMLRSLRLTAELQSSESRFRTLADAIPQLTWIAHPDGWIHWYNRRWYEFTGTTPQQMEGWGWQSVHDPEVLPAVLERWQGSIATGELFEMVFPLRGADGTFHSFLTRVVPLKDEQGRVLQWFGTNTDVTQEKRAQEDLAAAKAAAEQARAIAELANKAKDHFLAVLSHELRTPLTPVLATVSMLQMDPDLDGELREHLEVIRRNVELEARLIDDLLDHTRIAHGRTELNKRPVEIGEVLQRALEVCQSDGAAKSLKISLQVEERCWMEADIARMQQVFWNLIRNAIKFTPDGGAITVRCFADGGGRGVVEVADTGIGLDAEVLTRIFTPFRQAGSAISKQFGGLGLGLAISRSLVEMHGGTIEAQSRGKGLGAVFRVSLPLLECPAPAPADRASKTAQVVRIDGAADRPPPLSILLVEDHGDTANILIRLLKQDGHEVHSACNVAAALELAGRQRIDLVISDLGLPDQSGFDLVRELRHRGLQWPAIALSGYGQEHDVQNSLDAGFAVHVTKPIDFEQLCKVLERFRRHQPDA